MLLVGRHKTIRAARARRGECSFDTKMDVAINAGASALLVAETLDRVRAAERQPWQRWEAATMVPAEPCAVSCESGRGEIDAATLDASTVLGGLGGHCAASTRADRLGCASGLCAFSGPANHSHSQRAAAACARCAACSRRARSRWPSRTRSTGAAANRMRGYQRRCSAAAAAAAAAARGPPILPAFYASLTCGQRLASECGLLLNTDGKQYGALSSCTITILDEATSGGGGGGGYWDGSALLIWLLAL